jgi:hypothetical protein
MGGFLDRGMVAIAGIISARDSGRGAPLDRADPIRARKMPRCTSFPCARGHNSQKRGIRAGTTGSSPAGIDEVIFSRVMRGGRFRIRAAVGLREGKGCFGDGGYDSQGIPDWRRCNLRPRAYIGDGGFHVGVNCDSGPEARCSVLRDRSFFIALQK